MIVYRASEMGRCLRASVAERLGMKPLPVPDWLQKVYDGGVEHEDACVDAMIALGWRVEAQQQEVDLHITDDIIVRGHLDGKTFQLDYRPTRVLEIKSPGVYAKFEKAYKTNDWSDPLAFRYAIQLSCYMLSTDLEAVIACLDSETVKTFGVEIPPFDLEYITGRISTIEALVVAGLPDACEINNGDSCPFRYLHGDAVEVVEDEMLDENVRSYEYWRLIRKDAEVNMKNFQSVLTEHLADRDTITTANSKVTRYTTERRTIDKVAMADDGIDVGKYEKVSISEGLRVTTRGNDAEA